MSALPSTGSPELRGRPSVPFAIHDEVDDNKNLTVSTRQESSVSHVPTFIHFERSDVDFIQASKLSSKHSIPSQEGPLPLSTSKLGNVQPPPGPARGSKVRHALTSGQP